MSVDSGIQVPQITSVNSRGNTDPAQWKKLVFLAVVLVVVLGVVWGGLLWTKSLLHGGPDKAEPKPEEVDEQRKAFAQGRLDLPAKKCEPVTMLDKSGKAVLDANGKPLQVDCDGRLLGVPAIEPRARPGQAPKEKPDPFRGDMMVRENLSGQRAASSIPEMPPSPDFSGLQRALQTIAGGRAGGGGLAGGQGGESESEGGSGARDTAGAISPLLSSTKTGVAKARLTQNRPYLLPKGRQIDCAMTTRTINEVSGFSSCIVTSNVYSEDGRTLLIERGSEVQGEYGAAMKRGQRRLFVLWDRVRTPKGISMDLGSPAADGLGTMGLPGYVDNRWVERIGSALLLSIVLDEISLTQRDRYGETTQDTDEFTRTYSAAGNAVEQILADNLNIKPTLYANQGARVSIYVARDVDFSTVYAIR